MMRAFEVLLDAFHYPEKHELASRRVGECEMKMLHDLVSAADSCFWPTASCVLVMY